MVMIVGNGSLVMNQFLRLPAISHSSEYERCFRDQVWETVASEICRRNRISYTRILRSALGENIVFLVDKTFVIKIFAPFRNTYSREISALRLAHGKSPVRTPTLICNGEIEGWFYLVATQLAGSTLCNAWDSLAAADQFEIVSGLGLGLKQLHSWEVKLAETESSNHLDWETFIERQIVVSLERVRGMKQDWKDSLQRFLSMNLSLLPIHYKRVLLHGDLNPGNFLVETEEGQWKIAGLVDFADSLCGFHEYDFITPAIQMAFGNRRLQRALLLSYGYNERELDLHLRCRLMLLTILHESTLLQEAIQRIGPKAHELSLEKLEAEIWSFI